MVQQYPTDKHPLFVHKAFNSGPATVLILPAVYLLGYFGPGAGPLQALSLLVGKLCSCQVQPIIKPMRRRGNH